jgi:hypothetical protein
MKRIPLLMMMVFFAVLQLNAQNNNATATKEAPNFFIITTDGLRWQELFNGMQDDIVNQKKFHRGDSNYLFNKYGGASPEARREKLMPFFWNTISTQGQIYGNRNKNNKVDVANNQWFSYPGYSEILTGYFDTAIQSNDYKPNPNSNLFAYLNKQDAYKNKIAAFAAWNAFDRILNEKVSGFPVINSSEPISSILKDEKSILLSNMLRDSYQPWRETECLDVFTYYQAMHYLNTQKPKAMFISFGETDEWAHDGSYNHYLDAAHKVDAWIKEIWNWAQATPGYKDNTYILITTDHGRGFVDSWTSHGAKIPGASSIWFALLGPDVKKIGPLGEQTKDQQLFQKQLAATITKLIGQPFKAEHPIGEPIY